jgi:hypothetical protein
VSLITRMRKQAAVYWGPPVDDGDGGFTYPAPVEITCRWDETKGMAKDLKTHDEVSNSTVYVDRDVEINGYLFLGSLSEVDEAAKPTAIEGARRIEGFQKIPNLKATEYLRVVTL